MSLGVVSSNQVGRNDWTPMGLAELVQGRPAHTKPDFNCFPAPEMEPESAHVVSAVSVP